MKLIASGMLMLAFTISANVCAEPDSFEEDAGNFLQISDAVFSYSEEDGHHIITTIGTINNLSRAGADELVVEVRYFDGNKTLIDAVTQPLYGIIVPPGQNVSFRIRDSADKPKAAYASSVARVVSAEQRVTTQAMKKSGLSVLTDVLISWVPMLLLISVWIYYMRRLNRKDSPQKRSLDLIEKQNTTLARQLEVLERLAAAAEKVASRGLP